jgi:hypothetical protein
VLVVAGISTMSIDMLFVLPDDETKHAVEPIQILSLKRVKIMLLLLALESTVPVKLHLNFDETDFGERMISPILVPSVTKGVVVSSGIMDVPDIGGTLTATKLFTKIADGMITTLSVDSPV